MSQAIQNKQGETVQVLDKGDLNGWLWKLVGLACTTAGVLVAFAWSMSAQVANYESRVARIEAMVTESIPEIRPLRRTMDSLLIELRSVRREFQQARQ